MNERTSNLNKRTNKLEFKSTSAKVQKLNTVINLSSSLSLLNGYESDSTSSSSSSENEQEIQEEKYLNKNNSKHVPLPSASNLLKSLPKVILGDEVHDDPSKHGGRIRTFKHVRGNWATYVYIPVYLEELLDLQQSCLKLLCQVPNLNCSDDMHISLSQTVTLSYHLIESFMQSLKETFKSTKCLKAAFRGLKVYCNEHKTRTFIALQLDDLYEHKVNDLRIKVDNVMKEFKQPLFYKDPSYHCSFLWFTGNKKEELSSYIDILNKEIVKIFENDYIQFSINEICCKSGNKNFQLKLS